MKSQGCNCGIDGCIALMAASEKMSDIKSSNLHCLGKSLAWMEGGHVFDLHFFVGR